MERLERRIATQAADSDAGTFHAGDSGNSCTGTVTFTFTITYSGNSRLDNSAAGFDSLRRFHFDRALRVLIG
jgi:hypothetical protein